MSKCAPRNANVSKWHTFPWSPGAAVHSFRQLAAIARQAPTARVGNDRAWHGIGHACSLLIVEPGPAAEQWDHVAGEAIAMSSAVCDALQHIAPLRSNLTGEPIESPEVTKYLKNMKCVAYWEATLPF